ncbi:Protein diaphanous 3 [Orchesella cincta]|uniref:Protein diaphanous 3 n=1 Tax=Orchesella cincta TaxID=48709 RepID=A0A1D2N1Q1_ORCCI|nr:Protein diaphanous 3 [Orchesella cincta]
MEIFLKTWDIINLEEFLEAVRTLQVDSLNSCIQHIKNDSSDTGCISSLIQVVSKLDVTEQCLKIKKPKLDKTDNLISGLVSIPRLKEKLECIQFSMDFKELFDCISKRIESFIEACASVNTSEKFLDIIKLVMTLLNCLNSGGSKIYGFDIRGLCKLATNTFNDGTTTLLHFLIEYVSNEPSLKDSLDFYMDFQHLSEVAKTSIKDMEEQCLILKANETAYKKELEQIKKEYEADHHSNEMATATVFQKNLENVVQSLFTQLGVAKDVFNSCKERYGLTNSDITEVEFFKSLSDFIMAYQKIYAEINEQRNRESQKKPALSARLSEPSKNARSKLPKPKRKSVGAARVSQNVNPEERTNPPNDLEDGLLKFLEHDGGGKRRDRKAKKF